MIFKNYEYFLTIAEEGNISSAARKLFVSQPSLSQYLKRLETNLGVELFDHTRYPLQLTYAGERYLAYVQDLFNLDRRMQQEFSDITQNRRGKIRLGIAYWRGSNVLPQVLQAQGESTISASVVADRRRSSVRSFQVPRLQML